MLVFLFASGTSAPLMVTASPTLKYSDQSTLVAVASMVLPSAGCPAYVPSVKVAVRSSVMASGTTVWSALMRSMSGQMMIRFPICKNRVSPNANSTPSTSQPFRYSFPLSAVHISSALTMCMPVGSVMGQMVSWVGGTKTSRYHGTMYRVFRERMRGAASPLMLSMLWMAPFSAPGRRSRPLNCDCEKRPTSFVCGMIGRSINRFLLAMS